ncbi:MAG: hypothetical protein Q7R48_04285 [bacterium]|nr:hypothetical protein [bacterium]
MDFDPKTDLQKLLAKERGILDRLQDPDVSEEEKARARVRLEETQQAIIRERNEASSRRYVHM